MPRTLRQHRGGGRQTGHFDGWVLRYRLCWQRAHAGLGKTTFARSLARSANLPLFGTSIGQWFSGGGKGHLGDVIKQIDEVFGAATAAAPAILFLDELDALPDRRTLSDRTREW